MKCGSHIKVYSNRIKASNPPQVDWICQVCGAEGTDTREEKPDYDYDQLKKHFKERGNEVL